MQILKFIGMLLIASVLLSCSPENNQQNESEPQTVQTVEETKEPRFESLFEAKRALLTEAELEYGFKYYEDDGINEYNEFTSLMRKAVSSEGFTLDEAEEIYDELLSLKSELKIKRGDIACVYINTNGYVSSSYSDCSVMVVPGKNDSFSITAADDCQIKIRGNSTAGAPKKPYNIRFSNKVSLCGMDKGKKWTLLANMFDKSLIRNNLSFYIAQAFGCPYTSDAVFVDVYVDGQYQGNYTLCEPVTDGRKRVDIDVEDFEYLFEIDMNRNDGSYYFTPKIGQRMKVDKPEEVSADGKEYLKQFFSVAEDAMLTHNMEEYSQYIDVDSFVNFYLFNELIKNVDGYDFSTRYFLKDDKLYAGPVWDCDLSLGNVSPLVYEEKYWIYNNCNGYGTGTGDSADGIWTDNYWFEVLLDDDEFKQRVAERYAELQPVIVNLYQKNELGDSIIDKLLDQYGDSFMRNYEIWDINAIYSEYSKENTGDYFSEIDWLKDWISRRNEYLLFYLVN